MDLLTDKYQSLKYETDAYQQACESFRCLLLQYVMATYLAAAGQRQQSLGLVASLTAPAVLVIMA